VARLCGKNAWISGAGSGIGRSAALLFAREGATVAVAERSPDAGREAVGLIEADGGSAIFVETDVTQRASVERSIALTVERYGRLDVLYNNAGGGSPSDAAVVEAPDEEFWRAIQLNLYGVWLGCKFGIPALIRSGGGSVINTASNAALMGVPNMDAYTAAKGGVAAITRSMAVEYAAHKVRVNAIAPGTTATERVQRRMADGFLPEHLRRRFLLGLVQPEDVAAMALYLASDESLRTTGQVIQIDSGLTVG
jgi:NAD(P)-dependent dehydrogenase (short-subunit alcohol dehydrogenase family)